MVLAEPPLSGPEHAAIKRNPDRNQLAREVGANIKAYRKLKGFTLKKLADACGTTPQTMQRLESANMTLSLYWLQQMTETLGIEPFMLFGGTSAIARANEAALKAQAETAAIRAAVAVLVKLVNQVVPEKDANAP